MDDPTHGAERDDFAEDLDALVPETVPFTFGGTRYQVLRFEDVPTGGELQVLRLEAQIKAATTAEEVIELHRQQARILAPSIPEAVLDRMHLRQLKRLGQISLGLSDRPRPPSGARSGPASSSTSPAPLASTAGAIAT